MKDQSDHLLITHRKLPHWTLKGSAYFVTWRLKKDSPDLTEQERTIVQSAIRHYNGERYELYAYVVMNDHVHVVFRPLGDQQLPKIIHYWKSLTTNQLHREGQRTGAIWDTEHYDRITRDENELIEKCEYVLTNPQRRWPDVNDYEWAGWD